MSIIGIDLGSRAVKIVAFNEEKITYKKIIDTADFYRNYCSYTNNKISIGFNKLGIDNTNNIIATGYGRNNVNIQNSKIIVELKAHLYGALFQTRLNNFTLIDIGGQDSKVISVRDKKMQDMMLNDKCAASCGRYLENMSNVLGIELIKILEYYNNPVQLSSTCAVFTESELIGKISEGYSIDQLAAGVNYSLFKRIKPVIQKFNSEKLVITGGVAKNTALIHYIKSELNFKEVIVPSEPQLNGAIGCCAYYMMQMKENGGI